VLLWHNITDYCKFLARQFSEWNVSRVAKPKYSHWISLCIRFSRRVILIYTHITSNSVFVLQCLLHNFRSHAIFSFLSEREHKRIVCVQMYIIQINTDALACQQFWMGKRSEKINEMEEDSSISLEEIEHCGPLFERSCRYWPSSSTKGISPRSAAARPVRLIIFHKIFHENDSITCGDVRPGGIMLSHFVRRARTSCLRLISWQTRGWFINLPQSKINFASEILNQFIFTYYTAYSLKCLTEWKDTNEFYEKE